MILLLVLLCGAAGQLIAALVAPRPMTDTDAYFHQLSRFEHPGFDDLRDGPWDATGELPVIPRHVTAAVETQPTLPLEVG